MDVGGDAEQGFSDKVAPKIGILTETYYPIVGGGETQAKLLAESLAKRGHAVTVFTRQVDKGLKKSDRCGSIHIERLPPSGKQHWKKWGLAFSIVPALIRHRRQFDVLLISGFRVVGAPATVLCRILKKPIILKSDSLGELSGDFFAPGLAKLGRSANSLPFRLLLRLRNARLRKANAYVAISSTIATEYQLHGTPHEKIHAIPNCVDLSQFCPVTRKEKLSRRKVLGLPATAKIAVYTGRLVSYKGLPALMATWKYVKEEHQNAILLLVGGGGLDIHNYENELRQYVKTQNLGDTICFAGEVSDVATYLQAADLFVFPSKNEAFGISLIEAMACGLPAVGSNRGGVKDIIDHQHNGLLVNPSDVSQLADGISTLFSDDKLRRKLGKNAVDTVWDKYNADSVTSQYQELFQELLG